MAEDNKHSPYRDFLQVNETVIPKTSDPSPAPFDFFGGLDQEQLSKSVQEVENQSKKAADQILQRLKKPTLVREGVEQPQQDIPSKDEIADFFATDPEFVERTIVGERDWSSPLWEKKWNTKNTNPTIHELDVTTQEMDESEKEQQKLK
jgi:hypothetical protein